MVGRLANSLGHRLTTHPGQFTQLGSPKENVIAQSISELEYHCDMMDRMELGVDSVMIIHMGVSENLPCFRLADWRGMTMWLVYSDE